MLRQIAWWVQNGPITKNGVLKVTNSIFWNFYFSLRTSYKELTWCTNDPNVHIHTFCKRWSFIVRCFFPCDYPQTFKNWIFLSFLNYVPFMSSRLTRLRVLRALIFNIYYNILYYIYTYIYIHIYIYIYIKVNYTIHRIYEKTFRSDLSAQKKPLFWLITCYQLPFAVICSYLVTLIDFSVIVFFIGHFC